tara:strand:- start:894 stop:1952 length:1059 start_codon:yes stop_codon:yes gene_type:complete
LLDFEPNNIINQDLKKIISAELPWHKLKDKKICITGATGFLGSYLVKTFLALDEVFNLNLKINCIIRENKRVQARLKHCSLKNNIRFFETNILYPLPLILSESNFFIHAASIASPKFFGQFPLQTLEANVIGTYNILKSLKASYLERFLYFSSGEIYGLQKDDNLQINEDSYGYLDHLKLRSCYSESKKMAENICLSFSFEKNLQFSIVRPFHTYGPSIDLNDGRVFSDFVSDVLNCKDIILKSNGNSKRSFCYITDATIGFLTILLKGKNKEAYNIGNPNQNISVKELASKIISIVPEKKLNIKYMDHPTSYLKSNLTEALPSIEKIKKLGWIPKIDLKEGFSRTIKSFEK